MAVWVSGKVWQTAESSNSIHIFENCKKTERSKMRVFLVYDEDSELSGSQCFVPTSRVHHLS
ncbi:OLC1v1010340C1 [Oldenlandia corymbosa var. corymbosa]|uniref:OLC1v1010340C1 n=1 Tax=Oldenlandia corymbosa var. corymbosa TaxID=529605 RepID=A0AAV1DRC2_OLDCO|nr:OLC1v1010340C1 [Oldenlandia corymbosa var. corymbosa]